MRVHLKLRLRFRSDFHVGTGAGLGRVVDAVVARNASGEPIVPGSTIKGLARDAVKDLPPRLQDKALVEAVFGASGRTEGAARFSDAVPVEPWESPVVHGRSARDREKGRAMEDALFRMEDAAATTMVANVTATRDLDETELVLLIASLRRIEAVGGQRRRGKGKVVAEVEVREGPPGWTGVLVPGSPGPFSRALRQAVGLVAGEDRAAATSQPEQPPPPSSLGAMGAAAEETLPEEPSVLWVLGRADAPLVLSAVPEVGNTIHTLIHVPGTALRGGIARFLLARGWRPEETAFRRIFVRGAVHFGPLYPCRSWTQERSFPTPTPASLVSCKYFPGLRGEGWGAHGAADLLTAEDPLTRCGNKGCEAPLVPLGGFVQGERIVAEDRTVLRPSAPATRFAAHVGINAQTQRAEPGLLYGQEQLPEGTWLAGYVWGPRQLLQAIRETLDEATVAVGKGRTRGHGDLTLYLRSPAAAAHPVYPGLLPGPGTSAGTGAHHGFSLTLYSDLLAVDQLLRPVTRIDAETLWTLLGGERSAPFELVRGYSATRPILGFNGLPGRPRTPDLAIACGSTWQLRWADEGRRPSAERLLEKAQSSGLGLRRGEGFGRVVIDLPVHASELDETRGQQAHVAVDTVSINVPAGRQPIDLRKPAPPPQLPESLVADEVRSADRSGLARLLWRAADLHEPASFLREALGARKLRSKALSATDRWLECFVGRADEVSLRDELRAAARELDRLDSRERRSRAGTEGG